MKTGEPGRSLIKDYEKLRLIGYYCQAGKPTAGWGHTGPEVRVGAKYTLQQCEQWFVGDLAAAEAAVSTVPVPITQNQFDALVSLTFNIGAPAFKTSTLRKCLRAPANYKGAAAQFAAWNRVTVAGVRQDSAGLTARRERERQLFAL